VRARLRGERDDEERAGDEHGDERRLLRREAQRQQRADQRGLVAARAVEEPERDRQQRERDARDVDVLAREPAVVEVGGPERERGGGGERADPADVAAQERRERDHRGAHQRGREPRGEVGVAEQHVHRGGEVEAQRAVEDRLVLVVAGRPEQPGEVRVLALVVVERPVAEPDHAHGQRARHEQDVPEHLPAAVPHAAVLSRRIPP
jgi:hypothetical protein